MKKLIKIVAGVIAVVFIIVVVFGGGEHRVCIRLQNNSD